MSSVSPAAWTDAGVAEILAELNKPRDLSWLDDHVNVIYNNDCVGDNDLTRTGATALQQSANVEVGDVKLFENDTTLKTIIDELLPVRLLKSAHQTVDITAAHDPNVSDLGIVRQRSVGQAIDGGPTAQSSLSGWRSISWTQLRRAFSYETAANGFVLCGEVTFQDTKEWAEGRSKYIRLRDVEGHEGAVFFYDFVNDHYEFALPNVGWDDAHFQAKQHRNLRHDTSPGSIVGICCPRLHRFRDGQEGIRVESMSVVSSSSADQIPFIPSVAFAFPRRLTDERRFDYGTQCKRNGNDCCNRLRALFTTATKYEKNAESEVSDDKHSCVATQGQSVQVVENLVEHALLEYTRGTDFLRGSYTEAPDLEQKSQLACAECYLNAALLYLHYFIERDTHNTSSVGDQDLWSAWLERRSHIRAVFDNFAGVNVTYAQRVEMQCDKALNILGNVRELLNMSDITCSDALRTRISRLRLIAKAFYLKGRGAFAQRDLKTAQMLLERASFTYHAFARLHNQEIITLDGKDSSATMCEHDPAIATALQKVRRESGSVDSALDHLISTVKLGGALKRSCVSEEQEECENIAALKPYPHSTSSLPIQTQLPRHGVTINNAGSCRTKSSGATVGVSGAGSNTFGYQPHLFSRGPPRCLEGVPNFRDLGGIFASPRRIHPPSLSATSLSAIGTSSSTFQVKSHLLYRSASLTSASQTDVEELTNHLGVKTIIDLRTWREIKAVKKLVELHLKEERETDLGVMALRKRRQQEALSSKIRDCSSTSVPKNGKASDYAEFEQQFQEEKFKFVDIHDTFIPCSVEIVNRKNGEIQQETNATERRSVFYVKPCFRSDKHRLATVSATAHGSTMLTFPSQRIAISFNLSSMTHHHLVSLPYLKAFFRNAAVAKNSGNMTHYVQNRFGLKPIFDVKSSVVMWLWVMYKSIVVVFTCYIGCMCGVFIALTISSSTGFCLAAKSVTDSTFYLSGDEAFYRETIRLQRLELSLIVKMLCYRDNYPVIITCTFGKDRTGLVVALILALLGVSDEDIATDFARSNDAYYGTSLSKEQREQLEMCDHKHVFRSASGYCCSRSASSPIVPLQSNDVGRMPHAKYLVEWYGGTALGVRKAAMINVLQWLRTTYGSVEEYFFFGKPNRTHVVNRAETLWLPDEMQLTSRDIDALRRILLTRN